MQVLDPLIGRIVRSSQTTLFPRTVCFANWRPCLLHEFRLAHRKLPEPRYIVPEAENKHLRAALLVWWNDIGSIPAIRNLIFASSTLDRNGLKLN